MLLMVVYAELFDICRDRQGHVEKREKKRRGKGEERKSKNRLEKTKKDDNNSNKAHQQNRGKTITATKHTNKIGERQ